MHINCGCNHIVSILLTTLPTRRGRDIKHIPFETIVSHLGISIPQLTDCRGERRLGVDREGRREEGDGRREEGRGEGRVGEDKGRGGERRGGEGKRVDH